ncbi:putative PHD type zinc finger protein with BAH domain-containing protein [Recurvomyces mirabilis]|nr:putative PHD type zinc finger protein with BAH domain-containing protein [Recurvomyces mirabilis]
MATVGLLDGQSRDRDDSPLVTGDGATSVSANTMSLPEPGKAEVRATADIVTGPAYQPAPETAAASSHDSGAPVAAQAESQTSQTVSDVQTSSIHMDATDLAMADSATYGTRSRNRTGNARVNYAEDQDMDFDYATAATTNKKKQPAEQPELPEVERTMPLSRLNVVSSKESTPATGTAAATTSKKRKAASAVPQHSHAPTPPVTLPSVPAAMSRKPITNGTTTTYRETNIMTFHKHKNCLSKKGELIADDGMKLAINDHVYLVCEPPGDPYYLCRVMEFLHVSNDDPNSPVEALRVNWYYRPRDVQRFNSDTRLVYGTMHSDICPLASLRGKCTIKHRSEIEDLDVYRKERDSFYFVQVFDRFIRRWYECIPVSQIINVPDKVKKALDERWKFVVVEIGRVKELTSAVKTCKRCARYCASHDSVDCAICKNSYHMNCVQPPLPKKPSRGFAWACGPCGRASERKLETRNTPTLSGDVTEAEEEVVEEEEQPGESNESTRAPSPTNDDMAIDPHPVTAAEVALAKMWPMRYLGIHCRVEDALQYDDRAIYPRASSRLGPRHQANTNVWHGRPVELVKAAEIKKRYNKNQSGKKEGKMTKETIAALEADREEKARRPKWVQDEPAGYVARGEDYPEDDPRCTSKLIFKMPEQRSAAEEVAMVDDYVKKAKFHSRAIGVPPFGVNFLDKAMELFTKYKYDANASLKRLQTMDRKKDIHEPILTKQELAKFEEGVAKFGSEHRLIRLHMKTQLPNADIVRFYYLWKKTPKGREVWGNYGGRKGSKRKVESDAGAKLQAEVSNDADDSAFDNDKAVRRSRGFICKFCNTTHARQWRKAPGVSAGQTVLADAKNGAKDKKDRLMLALCLRCAGLWRKYSIQWEDVDEIQKKVAQGGGRAVKRRIDEELLRELMAANEAASMAAQEPTPPLQSIETLGEPPKKKTKMDATVPPLEPPKKKEKPPPPPKEPTPPPPPIIPTQPTWKVLPCAVCKGVDGTVSCSHCRLTVHRRCFGVADTDGIRPDGSIHWVCEQCQNDRHPEVSTEYACCLCLTEETLVDLVEPPKVSHKKKTDREREKERMEKELTDNMRMEYRNKQLTLNRPLIPREPLKRTSGNNWVHVHCSVWTPEIRYSNAQKLEIAEGFQQIPAARYEAVCKFCKNKGHDGKVREDAGACVSCFQCNASFHASCAYEFGCQFGFDVTPVKGSRKDQITTARLGEEAGSLTAAIWCKDHAVKSIIHAIDEVVDDSGRTALQVFVENYKQADLTLTGTVRKANMVQLTKEKGQQSLQMAAANIRRESGAHSIAAAVRRGARNSSVAEAKAAAAVEDNATQISDGPASEPERRCAKCKIDVTPRWHALVKSAPPTPPKSPVPRRLSMTLGEYADMQREKSSKERDSEPRTSLGPVVTGPADVTGAPASVIPQPEGRPQQNIRFMAPGANGRAWDGMPSRYGSQSHAQDEVRTSEQQHMPMNGVVPSRESVPALPNGDSATSHEQNRPDEGHHNHNLPLYHNAAAEHTPPADQLDSKPVNSGPKFLCHKCFVKKKIDPTPSPVPQPVAPAILSPPRQFPLQLDWSRPPGPPTQPTHDGPVRLPWDEPQGTGQPPPPPHLNGSGNGSAPPPNTYGPPPPPMHGSGYPPYGQPPNGYHQPPPPQAHHGPPPPPHMHQRQPSYGYGPPPHSQHGYPAPPRPAQMPNYPPTNGAMPNGVNHPGHGVPPPLSSPTHPYHGPPQQYQYPQRRTESPFSAQLPPLGQPLHASPPNAFARDAPSGPPGQGQHMQYPPQQGVYGQAPPAHQPPPMQQGPPPQQTPTSQPPMSQPTAQQAGNQTQPAGPNGLPSQHFQQPSQAQVLPPSTAPETPQPMQGVQPLQGGPSTPQVGEQPPGINGASASPNLRHLLH